MPTPARRGLLGLGFGCAACAVLALAGCGGGGAGTPGLSTEIVAPATPGADVAAPPPRTPPPPRPGGLVGGGAGDNFGGAVALSGERMVVGAFGEDSGASGVDGAEDDDSLPDSGAAYVFVRQGDAWTREAYLKASNPGARDVFGASVAIDGDTVVVGAPCEDGDGDGASTNRGAAYVFVRSGNAWTQEAILSAPDAGADDQFGISVAIDGATLVVGAYQAGGGAAYVFERVGGVWALEAILRASNARLGDQFGLSVAIDGGTIVVGARFEGGATPIRSGAAYVFGRGPAGWVEEAYLKAQAPGAEDSFGSSVAIHGDTIVVGAIREGGVGAAHVFRLDAAGWSESAVLRASNPGPNDLFGIRVAVFGERVLVGALGDDGANDLTPDAGAAYVFARTDGTFAEEAILRSPVERAGDQLGIGAAISADTILLGASHEDAPAFDAGAVHAIR